MDAQQTGVALVTRFRKGVAGRGRGRLVLDLTCIRGSWCLDVAVNAMGKL